MNVPPLRVLYANSLYPTPAQPLVVGGAETFAVRFCEELVRRGHDVVVLRAGGVGASWPDERTEAGVLVKTVPIRNLYDPWRDRPAGAVKRLLWHAVEDRVGSGAAARRVLDEVRPDVVHTNGLVGLTTSVWTDAEAAGVPTVHTIHDYYLTCVRAQRFRDGARCRSTCTSCALLTRRRRARTRVLRHVVSVSERVLRIHAEAGLFGSGVDTHVIGNPPPAGAAEPTIAGRHGGPVVFGFIGHLSANKGIMDLLRAFATLPPGLARLTVAGSRTPELGPEFDALTAREDVAYLGRVTPDSFYRAVDVTVVPSLWEDPSPMVLGESIAAARPVLGSRRGGIPELIDDSTGWLYDPDTDDLASLLERIARDPAAIAARSRTARGTAGTRRGFADQVGEYEALYRDVARSTRPDTTETA